MIVEVLRWREMEMNSVDKRAGTVMRAMNEVFGVMEDRDRLKAIGEFLLRTEPQFIIKAIQNGKSIPRYAFDLFTILTKVYDEGYANASEDLEKHK